MSKPLSFGTTWTFVQCTSKGPVQYYNITGCTSSRVFNNFMLALRQLQTLLSNHVFTQLVLSHQITTWPEYGTGHTASCTPNTVLLRAILQNEFSMTTPPSHVLLHFRHALLYVCRYIVPRTICLIFCVLLTGHHEQRQMRPQVGEAAQLGGKQTHVSRDTPTEKAPQHRHTPPLAAAARVPVHRRRPRAPCDAAPSL